MEMSSSVKLAVKEHEALVKEGTRLIEEYKLTKFDRIQFSRALKDPAKLPEVTKDLEQKILGPDFQTKAIKVQYGITKKLAQVNIAQFALYCETTRPAFLAMYLAAHNKVDDLIQNIILNPEE